MRSPISDWLRQKYLDTGKQSLGGHTRRSHTHLGLSCPACMCVAQPGRQEGMVRESGLGHAPVI